MSQPKKTNWVLIMLISICTILMVNQNFQLLQIQDSIEKHNTIIRVDSICTDTIYLPTNFNFIHDRFTAYNPTVDTTTSLKFAEVTKTYGLDDDKTLKWCIGQLLLESRGMQFDEKGKLVKSPTGAIGIGQILGSTCLDFMVRRIDSLDADIMCQLGVDEFSFAYDKRYKKKERVLMAKKWLECEDNNLVMWGYIMRNNLAKMNGNLMSAIISYNVGLGGLHIFLGLGNKPYDHEYIRAIQHRVNYVERLVTT